jgi:hypothetical protein
MTLSPSTKIKLVRDLDNLPPESLAVVAEFVEFLHAKAVESPRASRRPRRLVKLGGLWQGYSFSDEEIRAARREAWTGLGRGFDA